MSVAVRLVDVDHDPDDGATSDLELLEEHEVSDADLRACAAGWQSEVGFARRVLTSKGWARVIVTVRVEHGAMVTA